MLWWTLQKLKSSDSNVRAAAARSLAESRQTKAVPALIRALESGTGSDRQAIIEALGMIGDPAAVGPLISELKNQARRLKKGGVKPDSAAVVDEYRSCAEALAAIGMCSLDPLVELLDSEERDTRRWAAHALGRIKDARSLSPLVARLQDPRSEVRQSAARALGNLGESGAIQPLISTLSDKDPETRRAAAEALGSLNAKEAVSALGIAARDPNEPLQIAAVEALRRIGGLTAGRRIRAILENGKKAVREAAETALSSMNFEATTAGERAESAVLRGDFDGSLEEGPAALDALVSALASRSVEHRLKAVQALGTLGAETVIRPLLGALDDHDRGVQEAAANALAGLGQAAVPGLAGLVACEHASVRRLAAIALGRIGGATAADALVGACMPRRDASEEDSESRAAVNAAICALAAALARSADAVSEKTLERILQAPEPGYRNRPGADSGSQEAQDTWVDIRDLARQTLQRRGG